MKRLPSLCFPSYVFFEKARYADGLRLPGLDSELTEEEGDDGAAVADVDCPLPAAAYSPCDNAWPPDEDSPPSRPEARLDEADAAADAREALPEAAADAALEPRATADADFFTS